MLVTVSSKNNDGTKHLSVAKEGLNVKSVKSAVLLTLAGVGTMVLSACSAGQVSQTADQVAAVDGASGGNGKDHVVVRDVTIVVDGQDAAVKFTAINQDPAGTKHTLKSVTVDGQKVNVTGDQLTLDGQCSLVADSKEGIATIPDAGDAKCIAKATTSFNNTGLAAGGTKDVTFSFDTGDITVNAAIAAPLLPAGQSERNATGEKEAAAHSH